MCGITGLIARQGNPVNVDCLRQMTASLRHRGPDDEGYLLADTRTGQAVACTGRDSLPGVSLPPLEHYAGQPLDLGFGFRRLSILDLTLTGRQPMSTGDGRFWIVFNGEIYNFLELRQELESLGCRFRSRSDTEVLLACYARWGAACLPRLVGMFAFAIYDVAAREVFLARDFFGIKPLYYTTAGETLAFASEIKALLDLPGVSRQANPRPVYDYLTQGYSDRRDSTMFAGVSQLPPAHYLKVRLDAASPAFSEPVRYWDVDSGPDSPLSFEDAAQRLRELFLENVRLHLRSDVPLGAALSGGIDSSAIVMGMRHLQGSQLDIHTFTYLSEDPATNEGRWAEMAAQGAGVHLHTVQPEAPELLADLDPLIYTQDEPFRSTSIYAQYRVFRLAHENGIKVMLDGQGADEMLGGYPIYLAGRLGSLLRQVRWLEAARFLGRAYRDSGSGGLRASVHAGRLILPTPLQALAQKIGGDGSPPAWLDTGWFADRGVGPTAGRPFSGHRVLRQQLYSSFADTNLPMLLRYEDRNSMAFSIESRVPFLTPALANFIFSLSEKFIIDEKGVRKLVLRQALRGIVPDAILDRQDKIGFATPEKRWLSTLRPWLEATLESAGAKRVRALHLPAVREEWRRLVSGSSPFDYHIWRMMNLIRWADRFDVNFDG